MLTSVGVELQRLLDSWPSLVESVGEVGVAGADPLSDSPLFSLAFTSDLARRNRSAAPEKRPANHDTPGKCNHTLPSTFRCGHVSCRYAAMYV